MVTSLLAEADARQVEAAVAGLEQQTTAEVVVAVVPRSRDHWHGRVLASVAWALAAGLAFLYFEPWREPALAFAIEVVVGAGVFATSGVALIARRLVPAGTATQAVHDRALQLFAERGLHATRHQAGLLIFISELERRVVMVGAQALHEEIGQSGWDEHVQLLVSHVRKGQLRDGIEQVLRRLTPHLSKLAPPSANDADKLPNTVLRR